MKTYFSLLIGLFALAFLFTSCDKEPIPILIDSEITISNTLQTAADPTMGGTGGAELPIETILGVPAGTFIITKTVSDGIEFDDYLEGLYDINVSENQITYNLVAPADHPIYSAFFRTIEANTFDRYYFKFADTHNITSATSDNASVSLTIVSDSEILIEITEGFDFNPGSSFTISLN
ncbi:MAG: hypothetical protein AB8F95_06790 [Bacteroidia bacterium]